MKNVSAIDLNLLLAFDALMQERNVTRAGKRIGLAQPSMSNALSRLRGLMDDELFVRSPGAMVPTGLAEAMAPHIAAALESAETAINLDRSIDPASLETEIIMLTTDAFDYVFVPGLIQRLANVAPGVKIRTRAFDRLTYTGFLDSQDADVAIGVDLTPPKRIKTQVLYEDRFVCVVREGHPTISNSLTLDAFLAADHALFSLRGDGRGVVDDALAAKGLRRHVATSISNYSALPALIAQTDQIGVMAESLALRAAQQLPITCLDLPFAMDTFNISLFWTLGAERDPTQKWFRTALSDVVSPL